MLSKGRVGVKIAGRDSHHVGVILDVDEEKNRILVAGPFVRKRWINPMHFEPLPDVLDVEKMKEEEIMEKLKEIEEKFQKTRLDEIEMLAIKAQKRAAAKE